MKYIRTKDGRIISYDENANKIDLPMILNYPNQILKQADTIAELCDAYVFVSKSGETHYIYFKSYDMGVCLGSRIENDEIFRNHLLENGTIYGAIWTDKGLIYVAKMNDKGELILL